MILKQNKAVSGALWLAGTLLLFWLVQQIFFNNVELVDREMAAGRLAGNYDLVFMGNSHLYGAVQPQVVDALLGTHSYVLGSPNQNISQTYFELRKLLNHQQPQVVVIGLGTALSGEENALPQVTQELDRLGLVKPANSVPYLTYWLKFQMPLIKNHSAWKTPSELLRNARHFVSVLDNQQAAADNLWGYTPFTEVDKNQFSMQPRREIHFKTLDGTQKLYLRRMLSLAEEKGCRLIFVKMPIADVDAFLWEVADIPLEIIDFNAINAGSFTPLHFTDLNHVSTFGSLAVSLEMAQSLAEQVGYTVDETQAAYYSDFLFKDYTLKLVEEQGRLVLLPQTEEAGLIYSWQVSRDGKPLVVPETSESNVFEFPAATPGRYEVQVIVSQPVGEYSMEGIFSLQK